MFSKWIGRSYLLALLAVSSARRVEAASVSEGHTALPALRRVPVAQPLASPVAGALSLGYGYSGARAGESATHQRMTASGALGFAPVPFLQFSLRTDARYDRHPAESASPMSSGVLDPRFATRWIVPLSSAWHLGFELGAWFPGTESPSKTLTATTPHLSALASWRLGDVVLASHAGYRLDRSAKAAPQFDELNYSERLSLGLSDFDAALAGLGAAYMVNSFELLGEVSGEVLVGAGAPSWRQSPLHASAGGRYRLSPSWAVELIGDVSLSDRSQLAPTDPLMPIEPRFAAIAGLRFRLPSKARPAVKTELPRAVEPKIEHPLVVEPPKIELQLGVGLEKPQSGNQPNVVLTQGERQFSAISTGPESFIFKGLSPGPATLRASALGHHDKLETLEIPAAGPHRVELQLTALPPKAQLRGLVRSMRGKSLPASIRIEPLGAEVGTDEDGFFEIDVPPGRYTVSIEAQGYRSQRHEVVVEEDGVLVLNADMLRGR